MAEPSRVLPAPTAETPLLLHLLAVLKPMNRTRVKQLLKFGSVTINGKPYTRHDHPVKPGDEIRVLTAIPQPKANILEKAMIDIIYEDEAMIVVNKPAGLLTVATDHEKQLTLFAVLSAHAEETGCDRPYVVHRLDRDTSGVIVFARSPEVRDALQDDWESVNKLYLAVTEGTPTPTEGVIDTHLSETKDLRMRISPQQEGSKRAVTGYRVLREKEKRALLEVELRTGRKHQIRVHLASRGCPVVGDQVYGAKTNPINRLGLHAWKLGFIHPINGDQFEIAAECPKEFGKLV